MRSPFPRPPFPDVVDSSLITAFRACPQKAFMEYFLHYKTKSPSVHLHAGGAYAHGIEAARRAFYEEGRDEETSMALGVGALLKFYGTFSCPEDSAKSATRMAGALEYYFTQYPMSTDEAVPITLPSGKRGIEFSFLEPLDNNHPVTGDPLLYAGRFDMIADFAGGIFGEDDKTATSLGASWSKQWDMRSQFTAYCWGAAKAGLPLQGFLVRGVSILKTKYDTLQAVTYRPQWVIDRWYEQTYRDIERMKMMWEQNDWDYDLDSACQEYGGCTFRKLCLSSDPAPWIAMDFSRRKWDPVSREETELEPL